MQKIFYLFFFILCGFSHAQYIQVDRSYNAIQLVKDIFLGSSCIEVDESSIEITGFNNSDFISYGYFEKGSSNFPLQNGILLTSGNLQAAVGPNGNIQSFAPSNWEGDRDLEEALDLRTNSTHNATILEFDFISRQDDQINFEYIFASEQYLLDPSRSQCNYTDGFAFLIKEVGSDNDYLNIALVPNTNIPVKVNTVRGSGTICPPANETYFGRFNQVQSATNYNGQTVVLNAIANVVPGKKYHIKLVIADETNGNYDSGVFLKAGSFSGNKDLGEDLLISNGKALCFGTSRTIDATTNDATAYQWYKNGEPIQGATQATYSVSSPGYYESEITLASGCSIKGDITVEYLDSISIQQTNFELCDEDLDDQITITLNDYNNQIIQGYQSSIIITYHSTLADAQAQRNPITTLELNDSEIVYARIKTQNCPEIIQAIQFNIKPKSTIVPNEPFTICDDNLDGQEILDLEQYVSLVIPNLNDDYSIHASEEDARFNRNPLSITQTIRSNQTYFVRFSQANLCPNITMVSFLLKQPKSSTQLVDQTICANDTTTLDAGSGFSSYLWLHNGATTSSIQNVPVGTYHVRLEFNGCFYTQEVTVHATATPTINRINISGSTITVLVDQPSDRVLYALDDGEFQTSNTFYQVPLGQHTVHVKTIEDCETISQTISLIHRSNFISPNGDGKNDVLNFSDLNYKIDPKLEIFNRYGQLIFEGSMSNQYIWDGKRNGKKVPSGSYWYRIQWTEEGSSNPTILTNWILVKHKN